MRYIKYIYENGYCGCDEEDIITFEDGTTDAEINNYLSEGLNDYASEYEHAAAGYDWDEGWESEEDEEAYYENCSYNWTEVTEAEYKEWHGEE